MVRLKHEYERGCAVLVEHIYVFFLSLYILEKIVLYLVFERIDTKLHEIMKFQHMLKLISRCLKIINIISCETIADESMNEKSSTLRRVFCFG